MASKPRPTIPGVIEQLFAEAKRFDFFQAVRLLERQSQRVDPASSEPGQPVGRDAPPKQELVRFKVRQSLEFPVSEIESLARPDHDAVNGVQADRAAKTGPADMTVNFMGLTGPSGVLPRHYSQTIIDHERDGAVALVEFLDGFNHRLISLFYRAWEKYRAGINFEKNRYGESPADMDLFCDGLFSLVGMGTAAQRGRMAVDDDYFVYYSGNFSHRPPNALSLQGMLREFLGAEVVVQQLFGQWLRLERDEQTCMPPRTEVPTIRVRLGRGAVAGERVWDLQSKFRIRIGPIDHAFFCRMMPSADRLLALCQFVRSYVGPEFDFDVQLVLRGPDVPWCKLGANARLGWNTWIRVNGFQRNVDDVVFWLKQV